MQLSPEITQALGAVLVSAIVYGVHYLTQWLKTKTKNEKVQGALDMAGDLAATLATEAEQIFAPELAAALKDGKVDATERAAIQAKMKAAALAKFKALYGEYWPKVMGFGEEQLAAFLSSKLEAAVFALPSAAVKAAADVAAGKLPAFLAGAPPK